MIRRLIIAAVVLGLLGIGGVVGLFAWHAQDLPRLETLADYRPPQVTKILAADGSVIGEVFEERRTVLPLEAVPEVMIHALVSAEDKNFFEHSGLDYAGIAKAFIGNLRPGAQVRGASTLTQQLVKTMLLSNERSLSRKIKEAILAHRLEQNFSKNDILYLYLNQIFFGNNRYGIEEASQYYFGKSARELEVGEAAILASIPKDPNNVNPRANRRRLKERQAYVLREMVQNGYIPEAVALREIAKPLPAQTPQEPPTGGYYVEEVKRILLEKVGEKRLREGGLRVETAMNPVLQRAAEESLRGGLRDLDQRQGWRGATCRIEPELWEKLEPLLEQRRKDALARTPPEAAETDLLDLRRLDCSRLGDRQQADLAPLAQQASFKPLEPGVEIVARVSRTNRRSATLDLGSATGTLPLAAVTWARRFQPTARTPPPAAIEEVLDTGDVVTVRVTKIVPCEEAPKQARRCTQPLIELSLEQPPLVEGALVSIDPSQREVVALVGGYDHKRSPFNRATQARRQPGSAFKPFVYATALDVGQQRALLSPELSEEVRARCLVLHPRQTVFDTPEVYRDQWTGKPWEPHNFERDAFAGPISLRTALAESKNTVAVKLVGEIGCDPQLALEPDERHRAGLERIRALAKRAGIDSPIPDSMTAALGSGEVTPIELVNAYATIAMEGRYSAPVLIRRVREPEGGTVYSERALFEQPAPWIPEEGPMPETTARGLRPELAFVTSQLMRSVVEDPNGTARSLQVLGRPIAGKTGTASEHRDAWFVGFTPELVTGVWVGFDDHQMLGPRETGGHAAGPIWLTYMKQAEETIEPIDWVPPEGVIVARIDPRTGMLADEHSPFVETEYYLSGTAPTSTTPPEGETSAEDPLRGDGP